MEGRTSAVTNVIKVTKLVRYTSRQHCNVTIIKY